MTTSKQPDDQVVLPHRLTVYCIMMCVNSGNIHFEGGGKQPSLQPILQEREHNPDRASMGVFPAGFPITGTWTGSLPDHGTCSSIGALPAGKTPVDARWCLLLLEVTHLEPPWVPVGAPSLRKEIPPQRNLPRRGCREEHQFREPSPIGPVWGYQEDLLLVLPDLAQCLCKKAHWGKRIFA